MNSFKRLARKIIALLAIAGLVSWSVSIADVIAQAPPGGGPGGPPPGGGSGTTIITVTVQAPDGTAVQNAGVNVHMVDFTKNAFGNSGADGKAIVQDFSSQFKSGDGPIYMDVFPPFDGSVKGVIAPNPINLGTYTGSAFANQTVKFKKATKTISGKVTTKTGTPAASVKVNLFKQDMQGGGGFAQVTTDSAGSYTATVGGGMWGVHVEAGDKYVMPGPPVNVPFKKDESVESQTVNLDNLIQVNAKITGSIKTPDGSALPQGIGLGVSTGHDFHIGGPVQASPGASEASFTVNVPGDLTYNFDIFTPPNPGDAGAKQYGAPNLDPIPVKNGETKNIGPVTLVEKTKEITIKVKNGSTGMMAFAFKMSKGGGGGEFGMTTLTVSGTTAEGKIKVVGGGKYGVMVMEESFGPEGGQQQQQKLGSAKVIKDGGPTFVEAPGTVEKEAIDADAKVKLRLVRSDTSAVLSDGFGMVEWSASEGGLNGMKPLERGVGTLKLPSSVDGKTPEYTFRPMVMMGGFMPKGPTKTTLAKDESKSLDVTLEPTNATFKVSYVDKDGKAITGIEAFANAIREDGVVAMGEFGGHGGAAAATNISVVGGKSYRVGAFIPPDADYTLKSTQDKYTIAAGATQEIKLTALKRTGIISGKLTDPDGNPVVGAFVRLSNEKQNEKGEVSGGALENFMEFGSQTDKDGKYSIKVVPDTHVVRVYLPPETLNKNGWLPSAEQSVKVGDGETKTDINFQYTKANLKFEGKVTDSAGKAVTDALVIGYSNKGATNQVRTDSDGKYTMNATGDDTWHLDVAKDTTSTDVQNYVGEKLVDTTGKTGTIGSQDMSLTTSSGVLKPEVSRTAASSSDIQVTSGDFSAQFPANSLDQNNDDANVTVTLDPTGEMPSQEGANSFGVAVDVTATANDGSSVTAPTNSVTLVVPYDENKLPAGMAEADLATKASAYSYDPSTGAMRKETTTFDTDTNKAYITTTHLTTFGLAAATDTTPPAVAKNVKAEAGVGKVTLTWENPTDSDFDKINIYRSTESGTLGDKVKTTSKTDTSYEDSISSTGTYYYTLRSVDTTGNESTNTDQVSAEVKSLPKTGPDTQPSNHHWLWVTLVTAAVVLSGIGLIKLRHALVRR